jgi:dolichol-phosphate mannosyltransferase
MTVLICIPTYQEAENIAAIVGRALAAVPEAHVLVADDASPDGTGDIADLLAVGDDRVHVLHRPGKQGLGAAYRAAFAWGLAAGYDVLVEMDADGSHRPEQLPALLAALDEADVAIGSRWVPGGVVEGWPLSRRLISRAGSLYARLALGIPQRDATSGFRAYRADALRMIGTESVRSEGYGFQIEMLWDAVRAGLVVAEVPIVFADRTRGDSKMSLRIVIEALWRVTGWGLTSRTGRLARQGVGFLAVGGVGFLVDVGVFNLLRATVLAPEHVAGGALWAKVVSVTIAIGVNWIGNRQLAFRHERRRTGHGVAREALEFLAASLLGSAVALACLAISHDVLGLTSAVADNVSANVVGLVLGTMLRFVLYRSWVFADRTSRTAPRTPSRTPA